MKMMKYKVWDGSEGSRARLTLQSELSSKQAEQEVFLGRPGTRRRRNATFFTTWVYMYLEYQHSIRSPWAVLCAPQSPAHAAIRSKSLLVFVSPPTLEAFSDCSTPDDRRRPG